MAAPKSDQPELRLEVGARARIRAMTFLFDGADSCREEDVGGLDPIRRIGSGPRTSTSRPQSAPLQSRILHIRGARAFMVGRNSGGSTIGPAMDDPHRRRPREPRELPPEAARLRRKWEEKNVPVPVLAGPASQTYLSGADWHRNKCWRIRIMRSQQILLTQATPQATRAKIAETCRARCGSKEHLSHSKSLNIACALHLYWKLDALYQKLVNQVSRP